MLELNMRYSAIHKRNAAMFIELGSEEFTNDEVKTCSTQLMEMADVITTWMMRIPRDVQQCGSVQVNKLMDEVNAILQPKREVSTSDVMFDFVTESDYLKEAVTENISVIAENPDPKKRKRGLLILHVKLNLIVIALRDVNPTTEDTE